MLNHTQSVEYAYDCTVLILRADTQELESVECRAHHGKSHHRVCEEADSDAIIERLADARLCRITRRCVTRLACRLSRML